MTLVLMTVALLAGAPSQPALLALHRGMTQDDARQAAACRLKQPPGRFRTNQLSCSGFRFGGVKMELTLSFAGGVLSEVALHRSGYAEKRMKNDLEAVLQTLAQEFGSLSSPELGSTPVNAGTVFEFLKQGRTCVATSRLSVEPAQDPPGFDVAATVSSSRGTVPANGFWTYNEISPAGPPVTGSPFDLVRHAFTITLRYRRLAPQLRSTCSASRVALAAVFGSMIRMRPSECTSMPPIFCGTDAASTGAPTVSGSPRTGTRISVPGPRK